MDQKKETNVDTVLHTEHELEKNIPITADVLNEAVNRLALLNSIEYELQRESKARELSVRVSQLDKFVTLKKQENYNSFASEDRARFPQVIPWSSKVDTVEIIEGIQNFIQRFTVLTEPQALTVTLFVINTWVHELSTVSPVLNVNSPARGCGKSTLLSVIAELSRKPMLSNGITAAALYRSIDKHQPTVIYDEADMFIQGDKRMLGILNSGYTKKQAWTTVCDGENNEPRDFYLYAAKVIAGIGSLDDTLMSRCIMIEMKRKLSSEVVESIRHVREEEYEELTQKLARWAIDNADAYCTSGVISIDGLGDRENNNWEPLFCIANIAGEEWLERAKGAALNLSGAKQDELSFQEQLLRDIVLIFRDEKWVDQKKTRARSQEIVSILISDSNKPWATWKLKGLNPYEMSVLLKPFKLEPKNIRFNTAQGTSIYKGYCAEDFETAAKHYISESDLVLTVEGVASLPPT